MTQFTPETKYKSQGTSPLGDPFLTVKEARGYYQYAERAGIDSVAFILWDKRTHKFSLISESKPPLDEKYQELVQSITAFGGSLDMQETKKTIVQTEVLEEAGYEVSLGNIHFCGRTLVSSQSSQECYLYLVDITGIEKTQLAEYEAEVSSEQEDKDPNEFKHNYVIELSQEEVLDILDWKSIFIMVKSAQLKLL